MFVCRNHHDENVAPVKEGFLSSLASHFPFISSLMGGDIPEQEQARSKLSFNQLPHNRSSSAEQVFSQLCDGSTNATKLISEEIEDVKHERYGLVLFLFSPGKLRFSISLSCFSISLSFNQLPHNRSSSAEQVFSQLCDGSTNATKLISEEIEDVKHERYGLVLFLFSPGKLHFSISLSC
jgi:hypothetical protein